MVGKQGYIIARNIQEERYDKCQKGEIYAAVINGQKMKLELKVSANMKLKGG